MKYRNTKRIITSVVDYDEDYPLVSQYSSYNYLSSSFIVRYNAFLPFTESLKQINLTSELKVLDLGCADGPFLPTLNNYCHSVLGIEIQPLFLEQSNQLLKKRSNLFNHTHLIRADGHHLPLRERTFDVVFCLEVLEHVQNPKRVIENIFKQLKEGGYLICSVPVEIGLALIIRTLIGKILHYKRPQYTLKELLKIVLFKKPGKRQPEDEHKNFDWREIRDLLKIVFKNVKIKFIPIHFLRNINPLVFFKCKK